MELNNKQTFAGAPDDRPEEGGGLYVYVGDSVMNGPPPIPSSPPPTSSLTLKNIVSAF